MLTQTQTSKLESKAEKLFEHRSQLQAKSEACEDSFELCELPDLGSPRCSISSCNLAMPGSGRSFRLHSCASQEY